MIFLSPDVEKRDNPVCHFVTPLDGNVDADINPPAEVSVLIVYVSAGQISAPAQRVYLCFPSTWPQALLSLLHLQATESQCWKTRIKIVIREYHKWRTYFKKRVLRLNTRISFALMYVMKWW